MPVKKVNYLTRDIRSLDSLLQEQLILEVWTNGSIDPQDAVSQGGKILTELLHPSKRN